MTEETRSHNAVVNENIMLHEQLEQLRLKQAKGRTQTYQSPGSEVEVDMKLAEWMFIAGTNLEAGATRHSAIMATEAAIESWKYYLRPPSLTPEQVELLEYLIDHINIVHSPKYEARKSAIESAGLLAEGLVEYIANGAYGATWHEITIKGRAAIEAWQAQQSDSPTIDSDSD